MIGYWDLKNCNLFVPVIVVFTLSTIFSQFLLPEISSSAPALTKQNVDSSLVNVKAHIGSDQLSFKKFAFGFIMVVTLHNVKQPRG